MLTIVDPPLMQLAEPKPLEAAAGAAAAVEALDECIMKGGNVGKLSIVVVDLSYCPCC